MRQDSWGRKNFLSLDNNKVLLYSELDQFLKFTNAFALKPFVTKSKFCLIFNVVCSIFESTCLKVVAIYA